MYSEPGVDEVADIKVLVRSGNQMPVTRFTDSVGNRENNFRKSRDLNSEGD